MSANPDANQNFKSSQVKSFAFLDNAINPDARAANTPAVLRAENQDAKSIVKENIEKDLSSEYGNEFDVQQPYGDEFDVQGTEVINNEKIEHFTQPEKSEGGSSSSTEGEGDDKPLRPGGMVPGQARAEPNTYINADKPSKKSGLTRRDGTTISGPTGSYSSELAAIFCNSTIEYAKDQNVTYSNTTGGGSTGKESAEALGNSLNEASEEAASDAATTSGPPYVSEGDHKINDPGLNPELTGLVTEAADENGLTLVNRSGLREYNPGSGKDSAGSRSGRHTSGNAIDAELWKDGRRLSMANPSDVPYFQAFTQSFYDKARARGFNPSVGLDADYMGGTAGHFDIASGLNVKPHDGARIKSTYWGAGPEGYESQYAPNWLKEMHERAYR